jgi:predicted metalloprotease
MGQHATAGKVLPGQGPFAGVIVSTAAAYARPRVSSTATGTLAGPTAVTRIATPYGTSAQRVKWFRLGLETGDMSNLKKIFQMPYDEL